MKGYVFVKKQFWVTKLTWRFFLIKNKVFFRIRVPSFRQIIESRMLKFKFGTLEQNDAVRFTVWSSASVNVHGSYGEVIAMPLQKLWNKSKWKLVPYKKAVYLDSTPVSNHRTTLDPWSGQNRFLLRIVRTLFRFELKIADSGQDHGLGHYLCPPENRFTSHWNFQWSKKTTTWCSDTDATMTWERSNRLKFLLVP